MLNFLKADILLRPFNSAIPHIHFISWNGFAYPILFLSAIGIDLSFFFFLYKCEYKIVYKIRPLLIGSSLRWEKKWKTLSLTSSQMVPRFGNSKEQWWPFSIASVIVWMSYRTFHSIKRHYKQITSREVWLGIAQMDPSFSCYVH